MCISETLCALSFHIIALRAAADALTHNTNTYTYNLHIRRHWCTEHIAAQFSGSSQMIITSTQRKRTILWGAHQLARDGKMVKEESADECVCMCGSAQRSYSAGKITLCGCNMRCKVFIIMGLCCVLLRSIATPFALPRTRKAIIRVYTSTLTHSATHVRCACIFLVAAPIPHTAAHIITTHTHTCIYIDDRAHLSRYFARLMHTHMQFASRAFRPRNDPFSVSLKR